MSTDTVHLYNLALFNALSPISALHAVHMDATACDLGLALPDISHCDDCAAILIPGLTCSSRITYTRKTTSRTRALQVTCLVCGHRKVRGGLLDKHRIVPQRIEKKKKKKRNELADMLAAKRQQKPMGLFDFMP